MDAIITARGLSFHYNMDGEAQPVPVLTDIDLEIKKGEFVAVLGHNGSGKSTLAKLLNATLQPTEGSVTVRGMDTRDPERIYDIRQTVGLVFQNPDNQIVSTIVEEDVAFAPENLGIPPEGIRWRVDYALNAVGMYEFRDRAPHQLSGGQKQRVAIAGVIAMMPECLVLDEPTAMLDPAGRREVLATIHRLNQEAGMTVVLITHYMDEVTGADRLIVMDHGSILMEGPPAKVFSQVERIRSVGLEVPQATRLLYELRKRGFEVRTDLTEVEDCIGELCGILEE